MMGVQNLLRAHGWCGASATYNNKLNGGAPAKRAGSEGGAGIHFPHTPFSARPARANWFLAREARHQFCSKKVRAKDIISPQIDTSSFERIAPRGREAAALRKIPRRFAAKMKGAEKEKRADLFLFRI